MTDLEYMFCSKTMPGPSFVKWVGSKQYLPHKAVMGNEYGKPCQLLDICPGTCPPCRGVCVNVPTFIITLTQWSFVKLNTLHRVSSMY